MPIRFQLVDIHQKWIGVKLIHIHKQGNVIGQAILNLVRTKPMFLELPNVNSSSLGKLEDIIPNGEGIFLVMILSQSE
jgi:hypothetical protein